MLTMSLTAVASGARQCLCLATLVTIACGLCEKRPVEETASPGGRLKSVVFIMNCGATSGYTVHVALLHQGETLSDGGRGVFIAEDTSHTPGLPGLPAGAVLGSVSTIWTSDTELTIKYDVRANPARQLTVYQGIKIRYQALP